MCDSIRIEMSEVFVPGDSAPRAGSSVLRVAAWEGFDWLWHGFSTRLGGVSRVYLPDGERDRPGEDQSGEMNLGYTQADSVENVRENRLRFVAAITGSRETPLMTVRQVHSCRTVPASEVSAGAAKIAAPGALPGLREIPEADGLITAQAGLLIAIQTADCIPVLVADPARRAVGAFHAGWRGTVERIVELGVAKMAAEFGSRPEELVAAIGPGIGACCYTVGGEVLSRFEANFSYASELFRRDADGTPKDGGALRLDLIETNRRQLLAAGLGAESIATVGGCTACQPELFYSHRASGGHAGRMMAAIGIR